MFWQKRQQQGLTLIETLIASAIFVAFSIAVYRLYANVFTLSSKIRVKTILTEVAGEQFEFIRNLSYSNVGTVGGIPAGIIDADQTVTKNGLSVIITTTIRNIDDEADGTLGGTPNDLSPADKKLVAIEVACTSCRESESIMYTSIVAPKNLETENGNGALVIRAIDANGLPVAGADVHIVNSALSPTVDIVDVTGATGVLTIVDAPPSTQNYQITVTKDGYSSEQTYTPDVANPNPSKPHLTVAANTISQGTFSIDLTSGFDVATQDALCAPVGSISGTLSSSKLIGTVPDVLKHILGFTTSAAGSATVDDIEWDTYTLAISGSSYDVIGTNPISPLVVPPNTSQDLTITLAANNPNRFVVGVVDAAGLPVAGATVEIDGPSGIFTDTTSVGSVTQTDWSGGAGQGTIGNWNAFFSSSNVNFSSVGEISLSQSGVYLSPGELVSSVIDLGDISTPEQLSWLPASQPGATGTDSIRFQIASATTNDVSTVWTYLGPDGTNSTYYTSATSNVNAAHSGHQYIRYKIFLSTTDTSVSPTINNVALTYTSGCLPPGQVDFGGLSNGSYHVTVSKSGFQTSEKDITINADVYDTITITP